MPMKPRKAIVWYWDTLDTGERECIKDVFEFVAFDGEYLTLNEMWLEEDDANLMVFGINPNTDRGIEFHVDEIDNWTLVEESIDDFFTWMD